MHLEVGDKMRKITLEISDVDNEHVNIKLKKSRKTKGSTDSEELMTNYLMLKIGDILKQLKENENIVEPKYEEK